MKFRTAAFITTAVMLAALFVRLGLWQLDRLAERRAFNAERRARLDAAEVPFNALLRDPRGALRRSHIAGTPDFAHEFVITGRSRNGSPGVYVITPVRTQGNDTAVLVSRGWVYAADAATADLARWRESRTTFRGHADTLAEGAAQVRGRALRSLSFAGVDSLLPYPFYRLYLVSHDSGAAESPARLSQPALDDGPHLSYAIQWFCFAAIALVGAAIVARKSR